MTAARTVRPGPSLTSSASSAQVAMGRHDLGALVRRASADFGDDERVRLHLPAEVVAAACDPVRTVQVLGNLVGNALKYSAPGSPVHVHLTVHGTAVAVAAVAVAVQDRGRGIPADQLDKVFEKFHRVEDPMRMTTGGTGLGLYIARELTATMGGELSCTSALGVDSTFTLRLRAQAAADLGGPGLPRPRPEEAELGRRAAAHVAV